MGTAERCEPTERLSHHFRGSTLYKGGRTTVKEWRVVVNIQAETADEAVESATQLLNLGGEPHSVMQLASADGDAMSPETEEGV